MKRVALSVAGSDSSGGAGVQADLKSFGFTGVHGCSVVTCVTAQNTQGVSGVFRLSADFVGAQLDAIFDEFSVDAAKTGMLFDAEIAGVVVDIFKDHRVRPVVDPVMVATSGDLLSSYSFVSVLKKRLLPQSLLVTANVPEAEELTGVKVTSVETMKKACEKLFSLGSEYVLLKGGHLKGESVVDVIYDGTTFTVLSLPRISGKQAHGSGCTLSALITGYLAQGVQLVEAVHQAKYAEWSMINAGYTPGKGIDVLHHAPLFVLPTSLSEPRRIAVWQELRKGVEELISFLPSSFVAEVGMNFAYASESAQRFEDVCAVDGRLVRQGDSIAICGRLGFGVSKHVARIVLAAMSVDPLFRSALNIRYSEERVDLCKKKGFTIGSFDRRNEPEKTGSTMEWGTKQAIQDLGRVPDMIFDTGSVGKEPMIRVLGKDPDDVLSKLRILVK